MLLYHGSDEIVEYPLVNYGKPKHDFGQAFYLTSNYLQAEKWAKIKFRRHGYIQRSVVSIFNVENSLSDLQVCKFAKVSTDWLQYVVNNRTNKQFAQKTDYDLVIGPMIDGRYSWNTINDYRTNKIDFETALKYLKPENLSDQWAFKSEKAISKLDFRGVRYASY